MPRPCLPRRIRELVAERAAGCCEYCASQARFCPDPLSTEHIIPGARGGSDEPENLALSCQGCNGRKWASTEGMDSITGRMADLYHPRRHVWREHFAWNEDFSLILGRSPTGRATVEKLGLNREPVVNLRRRLGQVGEHPPAGFPAALDAPPSSADPE